VVELRCRRASHRGGRDQLDPPRSASDRARRVRRLPTLRPLRVPREVDGHARGGDTGCVQGGAGSEPLGARGPRTHAGRPRAKGLASRFRTGHLGATARHMMGDARSEPSWAASSPSWRASRGRPRDRKNPPLIRPGRVQASRAATSTTGMPASSWRISTPQAGQLTGLRPATRQTCRAVRSPVERRLIVTRAQGARIAHRPVPRVCCRRSRRRRADRRRFGCPPGLQPFMRVIRSSPETDRRRRRSGHRCRRRNRRIPRAGRRVPGRRRSRGAPTVEAR